MRRCGKSFLLFTLYHEYLNGIGVPDDHIVEVALDDAENFIYHNPRRLLKYLKSRIVGVVETFETNAKGSGVRKQVEIDFVANKADRWCYIQSALTIDDPQKRAQEIRPFDKVGDSFKKIILVGGRHEPRRDENGYLVAGVIDFMLSPEKVLG